MAIGTPSQKMIDLQAKNDRFYGVLRRTIFNAFFESAKHQRLNPKMQSPKSRFQTRKVRKSITQNPKSRKVKNPKPEVETPKSKVKPESQKSKV